MRALGTVVEWEGGAPSEHEFYCGLLDYYDHWQSIDPRLASHHKRLSPAAFAFGHDIVNMATYTSEILRWLSPEQIRLAPSVVVVGGMTEAFLYSVRSACDAAARALGYVACEKPGQAPDTSLRRLIEWGARHKSRLRPEIAVVLSGNFDWFWKLRRLRDEISHQGADAVIHCDGRQFNLWVHSPGAGWITREPLLPLLADQLQQLTALANDTANAVGKLVELPPDRIRSRVVQGVLLPSLSRLLAIAPEYAKASP